MSDFLEHLLKRTLAEKPVIRPRLPGVFEIERPAEVKVPEWEMTDQIDSPPTAAASGITTPVMPLTQPAAGEPKPSAIQEFKQGKAPLDQPTSLEMGPESLIPPPEMLISPAVPNNELAPSELLTNLSSSLSTDTNRVEMPPSDSPPASHETGPMLSPTQATLIQPQPVYLRDTGIDEIQPASHLTNAPVGPPAPSLLTPVDPLPAEVVFSLEAGRTMSNEPERSDQNELASALPQPPRLTVHIGRIEIRMTQPAGSAQVRRSVSQQRKPVMSLDTYLKQRSGEKP
jgi:hypothetical protein